MDLGASCIRVTYFFQRGLGHTMTIELLPYLAGTAYGEDQLF